MLDNRTYVNKNTPIRGLQYNDKKERKQKKNKLPNGKIITLSNKSSYLRVPVSLYLKTLNCQGY